MLRRLTVLTALFALAAHVPAFAQPRIEASVMGGFAFSDGVSGEARLAQDGNVYDRVDPDDGGTFGFSVGVLPTDQFEVGFLYGWQGSKLVAGGTNDFEIGDLSISTYHGYFAYNFGDSDMKMRPFLLGGLGATSFGSVDFQTVNRTGTIEGETQFSTTWAAGVKYFVNPRVAARLALRWTPTYIKSDAAGWWCDPYWGCYLVGDAQYSSQVELSGGVTVRF